MNTEEEQHKNHMEPHLQTSACLFQFVSAVVVSLGVFCLLFVDSLSLSHSVSLCLSLSLSVSLSLSLCLGLSRCLSLSLSLSLALSLSLSLSLSLPSLSLSLSHSLSLSLSYMHHMLRHVCLHVICFLHGKVQTHRQCCARELRRQHAHKHAHIDANMQFCW